MKHKIWKPIKYSWLVHKRYLTSWLNIVLEFAYSFLDKNDSDFPTFSSGASDYSVYPMFNLMWTALLQDVVFIDVINFCQNFG